MSKLQMYTVPVSWEMHNDLYILAASKEEAIAAAYANGGTADGEYSEGSYDVWEEGVTPDDEDEDEDLEDIEKFRL